MKTVKALEAPITYVAFYDTSLVAHGDLRTILTGIKANKDPYGILIFDEATGRQVDFDLRGSVDDICRTMDVAPAPVGRPRLGIVAREVTLLPRHWTWLESQPKGASAALRTLVDSAMQADMGAGFKPNVDAIYRIASVMAGNLPGFEEAARALYKNDWQKFRGLIAQWPDDLHQYLAARLSS